MVNSNGYKTPGPYYRENLRKTMPMCFHESFGKKVAIIIDCFEIFLDHPTNLQARAYTWSNYKHKNTAKVLIGHASDKFSH